MYSNFLWCLSCASQALTILPHMQHMLHLSCETRIRMCLCQNQLKQSRTFEHTHNSNLAMSRERKFRKGRGFLSTGKTPGISFLVEIFGEIPPRPGQVGNTWEMHYGTSTGSCGVHLVLHRPSQHSEARPGVGPHHGQILVQSL